MYKYTHFIPENIAPSGAKRIGVYNDKGNKVCSIPLGRLAPIQKTKLYSFGAFSDTHIPYFSTSESDLRNALDYVGQSDCAFSCICGDLTNDGSVAQLKKYSDIVNAKVAAYGKPVYAIAGNHEATTEYNTDERIQPYTGYPLYYSLGIGSNGTCVESDVSKTPKTYGDSTKDVFIMLGEFRGHNAYVFADGELQWLKDTLGLNKGKRCFVFFHVYPTGDCGDACSIYNSDLFSVKQGEFISILQTHPNAVFFHGHSHLRFDLQEIDKKANYSKAFGYHSVHIPSLSAMRDGDASGSSSMVVVEAGSEGYIVDVYDDCIVLNGRDFVGGNWLPIATYKIDTT